MGSTRKVGLGFNMTDSVAADRLGQQVLVNAYQKGRIVD
jgi:hypothetical protein